MATVSPIPSISFISSVFNSVNFSKDELQYLSNTFDMCCPTLGIPSPNKKLGNVVFLDLLIESIRFIADLSLKRSNSIKSSYLIL